MRFAAGPWLLAGVLVGLLVAETILFAQLINQSEVGLGGDYRLYRGFAASWLDSGEWYLPRQFSPHEFAPMEDNVYPPSALPLFVAGAILPWPLWWIIPSLVLIYCIYRWRPSPWAWVGILLLLMWPRSIGGYLYGNTTIWMSAGMAAGLIWGWPIVLLAVKPTLAFLAIFTLREKAAWVGLSGVVIISVVMLPLWLDYVAVVRGQRTVQWIYLLGDLPPMLIPLVAWLGATRGGPLSATLSPRVPSRTGAEEGSTRVAADHP